HPTSHSVGSPPKCRCRAPSCASSRTSCPRVRPETERRLLDVHPDVPAARTPRNADPPDAWGLDLQAPLPPGTDLTWRARGACGALDIPTRLFFAGRGDIETVRADAGDLLRLPGPSGVPRLRPHCRSRGRVGREDASGARSHARPALSQAS